MERGIFLPTKLFVREIVKMLTLMMAKDRKEIAQMRILSVGVWNMGSRKFFG